MTNAVPINLRVEPPPIIEIVTRENVQEAWEWWIANINVRTNLVDGHCCIFDQKRWDRDAPIELRWNNPAHMQFVSRLYLSSLLGDVSETICMSMGEQAAPVRIRPPRLEEHYRNLITGNPNPDVERDRFERFRYSLSKSLAFWVQLAHLSQNFREPEGINYSISRPNFLPDDKGPDGLALILNPTNTIVELRSVKSSVNNPNSLIASRSFRENRIPVDGKQLDEFYKVAYQSYGLGKLIDLLDMVCKVRNISTNLETRMALLGTAMAFNAMVVANDRHASYQSFDSFDKVCPDASSCIATYIGSHDWACFSDEIHHAVRDILNSAGVL